MGLSGDDRGQSVQVGVIVLFGFLVVAMAGYQAQVVPAQNANVEQAHDRQVQEQLADLRNAIVGSATGGAGGPVSLDLGTRYPDRTLFVNPPPVAGALQTGELRPLYVNGTALADPDANDAWSAEQRYLTRFVEYRVNYHVRTTDPRHRIESGVLFSRYDDTNVTRSAQPVVSGNRITLLTVNGTLARSGLDSTTVDPQALSVSTRSVTLEPNGTPTVFLPTTLPAETWREGLLDGQIDATPDGGADDRYVTGVTAAPGGVVIELEPATYRLQVASIGLGHDTDEPESAAVVPLDGRNATVAEGSSREITVEVRDAFTNPVTGARVNATAVGTADGTAVVADSPVSGADGRVTIEYRAPEDVDYDRTVSDRIRVGVDTTDAALAGSGYDPRGPLNATVNLTVGNTDASGLLGYTAHWDTAAMATQQGVDYVASNDTLLVDRSVAWPEIDATLDATTQAGGGVEGVEMRLATGDSDIVTFPYPTNVTDSSGSFTVPMSLGDSGETFTVATAASDSEQLTVKLYGNGPPSLDTFSVADESVTTGNNQQAIFDVTWGVSDSDANLDNVTVTLSGGPNGGQVDQVVVDVTGSTASGTTRVQSPSGGQYTQEVYTITVTVADTDGATDTESRQDTADGTDP